MRIEFKSKHCDYEIEPDFDAIIEEDELIKIGKEFKEEWLI